MDLASAPVSLAEFDYRREDHLRLMYAWAGSAQKLLMAMRQAGRTDVPSERTINNWRKVYGIEVVNPRYRERGERFPADPDFAVPASVESVSAPRSGLTDQSAEALASLCTYMEDRKVPTVAETLRAVAKPHAYQTALIASDYHVPFHHRGAVEIVLGLLRYWKPDLFIFNGDLLDWSLLGRHLKDPTKLSPLQRDLDEARELIQRHVAASPETKFLLVPGNHEPDRLQAYLSGTAPALASLNCLTFESLLGLAELGVTYAEEGVELTDEFLVYHGERTSSGLGGGSGQSARKEMLDFGISGVSGHTHHGGVVYRRDRRGYRVWLEGFCMCEYEVMRRAGVTVKRRAGKPEDWHLGCVKVEYKADGSRFMAHPVPIMESWGTTFTVVDGHELEVHV